MKKITLLLFIIFTFLFSTTSWGEWNYGSSDLKKSTDYYYDKDRIRKSGKYLYLWVLIDLRKKTNKYGNLSYTTYVELDCSVFRFKDLRFQSYNKSMGEGEMKIDMTPPDEWNYIKPDSVMEIMYNKVCEEHLSSPVIEENHKGETLFGWGKCCDYVWKEFGEKGTNPKYTGEVENGVPNGQGTMTSPNGDKYEGEWKDGKYHGQGTETKNGWKYVGSWENGGELEGTLTDPSGNKIVGSWKNRGYWNGTLYDTYGNILGKWVNGEIE